jgi:hypothetical protein
MDFSKGKILLIACVIAATTATAMATPDLDQKRIHELYNDGDFDGVTQQIAAFRQQSAGFSREDSIFIAKHLAVVYAANPRSVGQGKYWMNELLKLRPAADLVGMYVSDEIDRIFESVRREFLAGQRFSGADPDRTAAPASPKAPEEAAQPGQARDRPAAQALVASPPAGPSGGRPGSGKGSGSKRSYWIAGGSALAATAVGLAAYLVLTTSHGSAPETEITIPRSPEVQ